MGKAQTAVELGLAACEVCSKDVPISKFKSVGPADYFAYFCGSESYKTLNFCCLACYGKWKSQCGDSDGQDAFSGTFSCVLLPDRAQ